MSFARLIDHMGSDLTVVNAARISFAKRKDVLDEKDERLINFLAKHGHWTPFAHCMATFHIEAPIYVARQLMKHRVGLAGNDDCYDDDLVVNEISRRYVDDEPKVELPTEWRHRAYNKKQGSLNEVVNSGEWLIFLRNTADRSLAAYRMAIDAGVAPELARSILPLATLTEWYWTGSLAAWARVANLRMEPDAQRETMLVVADIDKEMLRLFPCSWRALRNPPPTS